MFSFSWWMRSKSRLILLLTLRYDKIRMEALLGRCSLFYWHVTWSPFSCPSFFRHQSLGKKASYLLVPNLSIILEMSLSTVQRTIGRFRGGNACSPCLHHRIPRKHSKKWMADSDAIGFEDESKVIDLLIFPSPATVEERILPHLFWVKL